MFIGVSVDGDRVVQWFVARDGGIVLDIVEHGRTSSP